MIKRLTNEEADKIIAARQAKIRQASAERIKRLEAEALRMMQGRQGQDYIPDETAERQLAEKIIAAYMDDVEELRSRNCGKCCNSLPSTLASS